MSRRSLSTARAQVALFAALVVFFMASAQAQPGRPELPTADLPVSRVVLFTNGVGYFEHTGTVTGDQRLDLQVDPGHMDDLLQSLVLQDFGGGTIAPVRYDSRDPLDRILGSYSLDLAGNPTLADLLTQARGESVQVQTSQLLEGVVISVERVEAPDAPARHFLNLSTDDGLRRVALDEVNDLSFASAELREEMAAALAAIARYRARDSKTVTLVFSGEGEREVRVAYVREMPVWKTSYRLVVSDDSAQLQGWAIFDNPTDLDLTDVMVSFVAGQPISFITSLFDPVYVERARVAVQTSASVVPGADSEVLGPAAQARAAMPSPAPSIAMESADFAVAGAIASAPPSLSGAGVEAQAEGGRSGATFAYHVGQPVSVARHESVMIPIVLQTLPAERVSHFSTRSGLDYPFAGVRITNATGLHLAAGTVSLYDANGFAGNAQLSDVVPGDSRVLSYAVDLELPVDVSGDVLPEQVVAAALRGSFLESSVRSRIATTVRVSPRTDEPRMLIVDLPRRAGYEVVVPELPPLLTSDAWRFGVALNGAEPAQDADAAPVHLACAVDEDICELNVTLEQVTLRRVAIGDMPRDTLLLYLENVELSAADRAVLERVVDLQQRVLQLTAQRRSLESRVATIHTDQNRIRSNMNSLDRNSSLYRRYVSDLEEQENELDRLGNEIATLSDQIDELEREYAGLLAGLDAGP